MTKPTTAEERAELRRLLERCADPVWRAVDHCRSARIEIWSGAHCVGHANSDDAAIGIAAVNALPRLLDQIEALEAERDLWKRRAEERRDHAFATSQELKYSTRQLAARDTALGVAVAALSDALAELDPDPQWFDPRTAQRLIEAALAKLRAAAEPEGDR